MSQESKSGNRETSQETRMETGKQSRSRPYRRHEWKQDTIRKQARRHEWKQDTIRKQARRQDQVSKSQYM